MYSNTVLDAVFVASVAVIWFMVGYQAVLFFEGHRFFERTRWSGPFIASVPDSEFPAVSVLVPCHNEELVISDTILQRPEVLRHPKIVVRSVAELLAQAIWCIHTGASISALIDKA